MDGPWQIVFDRTDEGCTQSNGFTGRISRESMGGDRCAELLGTPRKGLRRGCLFYRRTFTVPKSWQGKVVRLQFDAVNFRAEIWLNDTWIPGFMRAGSRRLSSGGRSAEIRRENTLIVRVVGPILLEDKRVDGIGPMETP